jgi:hypothetical protein
MVSIPFVWLAWSTRVVLADRSRASLISLCWGRVSCITLKHVQSKHQSYTSHYRAYFALKALLSENMDFTVPLTTSMNKCRWTTYKIVVEKKHVCGGLWKNNKSVCACTCHFFEHWVLFILHRIIHMSFLSKNLHTLIFHCRKNSLFFLLFSTLAWAYIYKLEVTFEFPSFIHALGRWILLVLQTPISENYIFTFPTGGSRGRVALFIKRDESLFRGGSRGRATERVDFISTHLGAPLSGLFRDASKFGLVFFSLTNNFLNCMSHAI